MAQLKDWMGRLQGTVARTYDCLDMFGASQRVAQTWKDAGYRAIAFDVKLSKSHDLCSKKGVQVLLRMALELFGCEEIHVFSSWWIPCDFIWKQVYMLCKVYLIQTSPLLSANSG